MSPSKNSKVAFEDLHWVILDCPYLTWENELTQKLFSKMVALKFRGYQNAYGAKVLPIDGSDFVATHYLVCRKQGEDGGLVPLLGFRSFDQSRCQEFNLPFPVVSLLKAGKNTDEHLTYVTQVMQECEKSGASLSYLSSLTMEPWIRDGGDENQVLAHRLISHFESLIYFQFSQRPHVSLLGGGVIQYRIPQVLKLLGFEEAKAKDQPLPPFGAAFIHDTSVQLMRLRKFSPYAELLSKKYRELWEKRLVIAPEDSPVLKKAA